MEGQTTIRKKGKGRTDNTMEKDRQHNGQWPSERRVNGRTDNTMAIRKKGKWKDRQHNGHQKEG